MGVSSHVPLLIEDRSLRLYCRPEIRGRSSRGNPSRKSTTWSTQAQTTEPKDTLEMCKQHLNTFAIATRSLECFGLGQRSRHVTSLLVDAALDSAQWRLWTTLRLEEAAAAIACLSSVV
jgi:hypothetical protein